MSEIKSDEYMKENGFVKELTYYDIQVANGIVTLYEYDFYADEENCSTALCGGSADGIWLKIQNGTLTKTCVICRTTDILGLDACKRAPKVKQINPNEAYEVLRNKMSMSHHDVLVMQAPLLKLRKQAARTRKVRRRPRPKST